MSKKTKRSLRPLDARELARARGGGLLIPAVQRIRDAATPTSAGTIYLRFEGVTGEATE